MDSVSYTSLNRSSGNGVANLCGFKEFAKSSSRRTFIRDMAVEIAGTFTLLVVICMLSASPDPISMHQGSMAVGLIVSCIIWVSASTSGGFINPAITISAIIVGVLSPIRGFIYIICQLIGSYLGVIFTLSLLPRPPVNGKLFAQTILCDGLHPIQGVFMEAFVTFVLTITVMATIDKERTDLNGSGPLSIGLAVACTCMFSIPYTGCSLNPARSFGPALSSNYWQNHWVYWVGPILGSIIAGIIYKYTMQSNLTKNDTISSNLSEDNSEKHSMTLLPQPHLRSMTLPIPTMNNTSNSIMKPVIRKTSLPTSSNPTNHNHI